MIQKLNTFVGFSARQKKIVFAVFLLSVYRFILLLISTDKTSSESLFKKYRSDRILTPNDIVISREIARAIGIGVKYIPWENKCRHQSWQAIKLLVYYNIPFSYYVGVKKINSGKREGHSWVKSGDRFIAGFCNTADYILINF